MLALAATAAIVRAAALRRGARLALRLCDPPAVLVRTLCLLFGHVLGRNCTIRPRLVRASFTIGDPARRQARRTLLRRAFDFDFEPDATARTVAALAVAGVAVAVDWISLADSARDHTRTSSMRPSKPSPDQTELSPIRSGPVLTGAALTPVITETCTPSRYRRSAPPASVAATWVQRPAWMGAGE